MIHYAHSTKPLERNTTEEKYIRWENTTDTFEGLVTDITNGYAIACCFTDNHTFSMSQKSKANWNCSSIICYDFDAVRTTAEEMNNVLSKNGIQPNIIYRTANDGKRKKDTDKYLNRYRLVYVFTEPYRDYDDYVDERKRLKYQIESVSGEKSDKRADTPEHFFYTVKGCKPIINCPAFNKTVSHGDNNIEREHYSDGVRQKTQKRDTFETEIQKMFWSSENPFGDVLRAFMGQYVNMEATQFKIAQDAPYAILEGIEYREIKRKWRVAHFDKKNGDTTKYSHTSRISDGHGRKRVLFLNGIIRRLISPTLTFDDILYCLCYEMEAYIDNSKDPINRQQIWDIAKSIMKADLNDYTSLGLVNKKYIVNKEWCMRNGYSSKGIALMARNHIKEMDKKRLFEEFGEVYDPSLSLRKNVEIMKGFGIKVSKDTLSRFIKENNIQNCPASNKTVSHGDNNIACEHYSDGVRQKSQKRDKKQQEINKAIKSLYSNGLSIRDNLRNMEDMGLKISRGTLYRWLKTQKRDTFETKITKAGQLSELEKYDLISQNFNPQLTVKQNCLAMREMGIQVNKREIRRWLKGKLIRTDINVIINEIYKIKYIEEDLVKNGRMRIRRREFEKGRFKIA